MPGSAGLEPGIFVERMLPEMIGLANAMMDATPVETLPNVNPADIVSAPPSDRDSPVN
jgi:hypothetical protein